MGCASSSPLAAGNGGILHAAKGAVADVVHSGEEKLNDAKETISDTLTGTVETVKGAVVGAVQNVGQGLENVLHGNKNENSTDSADLSKVSEACTNKEIKDSECVVIPLKEKLKDIQNNGATMLNDVEERINQKTEEVTDETDKLADDLIKETEDVINDNITNSAKMASNALENDIFKSPNHSEDSLKSNSTEQEIERAFANDTTNMPSKSQSLKLEPLKVQNLPGSGKDEYTMNSIVSKNGIENPIEDLTVDVKPDMSNFFVKGAVNSKESSPDDKEDILEFIENFDQFEVAVRQIEFKTSRESEIAPISETLTTKEGLIFTNFDDNIRHNYHGYMGKSITDEELHESDFNFDSPPIISSPLSGATAWEKLTDAMLKLPSNQIQSYQKNVQRITKRSVSVDNILGSPKTTYVDQKSTLELY